MSGLEKCSYSIETQLQERKAPAIFSFCNKKGPVNGAFA
jgi:hypothetical protein